MKQLKHVLRNPLLIICPRDNCKTNLVPAQIAMDLLDEDEKGVRWVGTCGLCGSEVTLVLHKESV